MNHVILFYLINEVVLKDATAQSKTNKTYTSVIGKQKSVYQNEFYKAEQAGIRSEGIIETSVFSYNGQRILKIDQREYAIYRTFLVGTDRIELYYGERVGTNGQSN